MKTFITLFLITSISFAPLAQKKNNSRNTLSFNKELYNSINYRLVGPFRGGRAGTVAGVIGNNNLYYMGTAGGGVWKTEDAGNTWESITNKLSLNTPNIKKKDLKKFKFFPLEVSTGDIIIFDWKCCHYSNKNKSNKSRMILYLTYCDKNKKNMRKIYYEDRELSKTNINFKSCIYK